MTPGDTKKKYPIVIDSRTVIFISDKSEEESIRQRYQDHIRHAYRPPVLKGANHKPKKWN